MLNQLLRGSLSRMSGLVSAIRGCLIRARRNEPSGVAALLHPESARIAVAARVPIPCAENFRASESAWLLRGSSTPVCGENVLVAGAGKLRRGGRYILGQSKGERKVRSGPQLPPNILA